MLRCNYRPFIEKFDQFSEYFIMSIRAREMFSEVQTYKRTLSRVFHDPPALAFRHLDLIRDMEVLVPFTVIQVTAGSKPVMVVSNILRI